jgi:hypothetical protein
VQGFDGILGIGRLPNGSDYTNQTEFLAGLASPDNKDGIAHHTAYLDMHNRKMHLGEGDSNSYRNKTLHGFLTFKNQYDNKNYE